MEVFNIDDEEMSKMMKSKFVLHVSPLEIVDDAVINNIDETELIIDVKNYYFISQYLCPRSSSSSNLCCCCQIHPEFLHPRDDDDDDEDMILASCRPSPCGDLKRRKIMLDSGVFAAASASDDDHHIMSNLLNDVDIIYEIGILHTSEHLVDLKRSITRRISEAKTHVLKVKPRRVSICVDVSKVSKRYFRSAEAATFVSAMDADTDASLSLYFPDDDDTAIKWPALSFIKRPVSREVEALHRKTTFDKEDIKILLASLKPASRLSKDALLIKTFEKEDLQFLDDATATATAAAAHPIGEGGCSSSSSSSALISNNKSSSIVVDHDQLSSSYSCPLCLKELVIGEDIIKKMPCSHVFHYTCLDDWLRTINTCPLCPFELPTFNCFQRKSGRINCLLPT